MHHHSESIGESYLLFGYHMFLKCFQCGILIKILDMLQKTETSASDKTETTGSGLIPSQSSEMCQTDEHKAKNIASGVSPAQTLPRPPCVADLCKTSL